MFVLVDVLLIVGLSDGECDCVWVMEDVLVGVFVVVFV